VEIFRELLIRGTPEQFYSAVQQIDRKGADGWFHDSVAEGQLNALTLRTSQSSAFLARKPRSDPRPRSISRARILDRSSPRTSSLLTGIDYRTASTMRFSQSLATRFGEVFERRD